MLQGAFAHSRRLGIRALLRRLGGTPGTGNDLRRTGLRVSQNLLLKPLFLVVG